MLGQMFTFVALLSIIGGNRTATCSMFKNFVLDYCNFWKFKILKFLYQES